MTGNGEKYTVADAMTDALVRSGVEHIFLNSGTDYPAIIEGWAKFKTLGKKIPEIFTCPHETVAMSAAQGYAQATGKPDAVFVHVDVGTQNIGGALSNAYRGHVPVLIFAGLSPCTIEGELPGSRDNMIQFIQNVTDQNNIVREYVKHCAEIRVGVNAQQIVYRAIQLSKSDTKGPVYITATREVLEKEGRDIGEVLHGWAATSPLAVEKNTLEKLTEALSKAKNPIIITSSLGKNHESVMELVKLCEKYAIGVVEAPPSFMNFPGDHDLHLGTNVDEVLKDSDFALVIDAEVPWLPIKTKCPENCRLFYIDIDPIKDTIPLWNYPAELFIRADSYTALKQIIGAMEKQNTDNETIAARYKKYAEKHAQIRAKEAEKVISTNGITPEFLVKTVAEVTDENTIILNEAITNTAVVENYMPRNKPGTRFHSEGSSLGWNGGAAIGIKLANPESEVIAFSGDGTYIFSCPSAVYWVARKYKTPFMTIVFNNGGWTAPRLAVEGGHPDGYAAQANDYWTDFDQAPDYELIAKAAGGAFAARVEDPNELSMVIQQGREAVQNGLCAVINVVIASCSK